MKALLVTAFLFASVLGAARAATAALLERLFWGSLLCSVALGVAMELECGGFWGIVAAMVFILSDISIYLFFRTARLQPESGSSADRLELAYWVFVVWIGLSALTLASWEIFQAEGWPHRAGSMSTAFRSLVMRFWMPDWTVVSVLLLFFVPLVTGGFFLVRGEKK